MIRRLLLAHLEKFITGVSQVVAIIKSGTTRNALFFENNYTLGNFLRNFDHEKCLLLLGPRSVFFKILCSHIASPPRAKLVKLYSRMRVHWY